MITPSRSGRDRVRQSSRALGGRSWPSGAAGHDDARPMIRKLPSGKYRLYSTTRDPRTGRRRNLGTFTTRVAAERHEREVEFYKQRRQSV